MNARDEHPELDRSDVVEALPEACADETAAVEFFEGQRWGDKPVCPHCESENVYKLTSRFGGRNVRYLWRCRACSEQYTVRINTVFEDSKLPLRHWAYTFWRACSSKKGVSAREIQRHCQVSYKSSLFLLHRVRFALTDDPKTLSKLGGGEDPVEIDETYVGGKPRPDGTKHPRGRATKKTPVVAMVQRNGDVRTQIIANVTAKNLYRFVNRNVDKNTTVNTDQFVGYKNALNDWRRHDMVNHSRKEYARHNADGTTSHVNTAESFFSLLKRGINGIYHAVSKEHLHRYCGEFTFRLNTRKLNDGERISRAIQSAEGKRLIYREKEAK